MSNEFRSFNAHLAAMNNLPSEEDFTSLFSSEEMDVFKKFQEEEPQAEQPVMDQGPIQEPELTAEEIEQYNAYVPQSPIGNTRYSLDELEKDPEFQERASRFMEDIGRNEDIFEYLRDSDWSLTSAIARSMEIKDWSSQAKQDYIYLRDTFDNAEIGGLKQTINLFKDATIDTLADPFTLAAFAGAAITGGTSIGTKTAIEQALKQGIKKQAKAELRQSVLKDAKKTALFTAAEGAAWVGPHDYFLQKADVELDLKNNIDYGNTAIATAFGGVFGGAFGGLLSLSPFLNKQLRLYSDEDTIIKAADEGPEQLELDWKTEEDRRAIADDSVKGFSKTDKWIANSFGKYTTRFKEAAKNSETLEVLLSNFRYDWARSVFDTAVAKIDRSSFGESLSKMRGGWISKLNEAIVKLDRTGQKERGGKRFFWINRLDFEQNDQLYFLLSEDINARVMPTELGGAKIEQRTRDAAVGIRNLYNEIFAEAQNFNNKSPKDRRQYAWKLKDQGLIDNVEDYDLIFDALIDPKDDPVKNYFSRKLQHEKIKNNPEGFEDMLKNYGRPDKETGEIIPHAMPNNEIHPRYIKERIDEITGELRISTDLDAKTVDEESFSTNFMLDENGNPRTVEEAMNAKAAAIRKGVLDRKDNPLEAFSNGVNRGAVNVEAGTTGFMKERLFDGVHISGDKNAPDISRVMAEFIDTDVENVLNEYITSASMIINRERFFGRNDIVFTKRYLTPIKNELEANGVTNDEAVEVQEKLKKFYSRVTGIDIPDIYGDTGWRTAADWGKTAQTMAHLPLATLSSITEPLILLTRVGYTGGPRAGLDVAQALVKESKKMGERIKNATKRQFGLKTQGTKDVTDEVWKEAYQVGLALEQAVHDRLAGLYGEIHSNTLKRANRGFFKATLLQQWTSAVQLAAFTTGKRQIRQHAELLAKGGLSDTRRNRLIGELRELGVDETKAVRWYNNSLDEKGVFNEVLSQQGEFNRAFYNNQYTGGANRFSREIILNPDVTEANKPLWYTHPAGMILMQFASYPTAFNNTILKRYGREISRDITDGTIHVATPKIIATALLMTNVGILTNAARSQGKSLDKEREEIILDGIDRWGGLGPLNHAYRYYENTQRGSGPIGGFAKAGSGPLLQDLLDSILYRKGLAENVATNLPFYATYDLLAAPFTGGEGEARKALRDSAKDLDKYLFEVSGLAPKKKPKPPKKRKPRLQPFDKGGLVENVPQVSEEPDERIDRMTGLPYNIQAGVLGQDEEDRQFFAKGGIAEAKQTEQEELYNTVSKKVRRLAPIYKDKEPLSTYTEEELADFKKGITVPMYRNIKEDTEEQNLIDFRESEIIGVHVSSSPESDEAVEGYVRLVNPLDISDNDVPLEGFAFLEEIENNPEFKDKIVTDSMLPDQTAKEIVEDILFEHGLIKRAIKGKEETPTLSKLLNINASYEIRESFKDLGFDSIVYSQGNTVDDQMEDLGMRERFFAGGVASLTNKWAKQFFSKKYVGGGRYSAFINDLKKKGLSQKEINKISLEIREDHLKVLKEKVPQFKDASIDKDGSTIKLSDAQIKWLRKKEPTFDRVMVGNHGIYVEFKEPKNKGKKIKPRMQYVEWNRGGDKLYQQTKTVNYANYRPGKWYNDLSNYLTKPTKTADRKVEITPWLYKGDANKASEQGKKVYLFGDNDARKGTGKKSGQAVIRDELNAHGIRTKKEPKNNKTSFYTDAEYAENIQKIDEDFNRIPKGATIVIPKDGLGTGNAQLKQKAPKTFAYLENKLAKLTETKKAAGKKAVVFDNNQYKPVQKVKPEEVGPRTLYIFADNVNKKYKKGSISDRASKMPNGFGVTVSRADVSNFKTAKVTDYFRDKTYVTEGTMLKGKDSLVSENLKIIHKDMKNIIEAFASGNFDSIQIAPDLYRPFKLGYSPQTAGILRGKMSQIKELEKSKPAYVAKAYPKILKDIIGMTPKAKAKRVYLEPNKSGKSWVIIDPKQDVLYDAEQNPYQMIEQYFDPEKADLWKKETPAFVPGTTISTKKGVTQSGLERYDIEKRPRKGMYDQDLELKEMQRELEFDNPYLAAKSRIKMYTDPTKNEYNPDMADQIIAEYFPGADSVDDILKLDDATISAFGERLKQIGGEGDLSESRRKQQFNEILKYLREEQRQKKAEGGEIKEIEVKAYKRTGQRGRPAYEYAIEMLGEDELDKLFLKEIAFVESKWANDEGTFRPNNRSAYQISEIRFDEFKETNKPESKRGRGLRAYTKKINDRWNIDLSNIEYDDLNDPVIGTAVTRALLKLSPEAIGKTPKERARQWKSFWNTEHKDAKGTVEKYLSDVAAMENYPVKRDLLGSLLNEKKNKKDTGELFKYGVGVDTPVFKTEEEVNTYINELPRQTRSAVRGMLEGFTRYSGLGSVMAGVELGAYEQARAAAGFRDSLLEGDIKKPSFLEAEDKYVKGIGKALSPGDIDPMTATVVEQAAGLTALGIGVQEGINLIRYFGPKAVTKVKSYFKENPKATVDEAVSGILKKEVSRRDVLKGMGTGAVATTVAAKAVPSLLGKGAGAAYKGILHPSHAVLKTPMARDFFDVPKEMLGDVPIEKAIKIFEKQFPFKIYSKNSEAIVKARLKDIRNVDTFFKKYNLKIDKDTTRYGPDDDAYNFYADVEELDYNILRGADGSQAPPPSFRQKYDELTDIYTTKEKLPTPKSDYVGDPLYEQGKRTAFDGINARLDRLKIEKSPDFKGEKNGIEFFELDGSPIVRKKDTRFVNELFDNDPGAYSTYRNDPDYEYAEYILLIPNNNGIKKLNK